MHFLIRPFLSSAPAVAALLAVACAAQAQTAPSATAVPATPASRIERVTLYQGSATVERALPVRAGTREVLFTCLPATLDAQSVQLQGEAGLRIGEVRVQTVERALASDCASPLDGRVRTLEDELARVQAARGAEQVAADYFKSLATAPPGDGARSAAQTGAQIQATADALRRGTQESQGRAHQLQREEEALELRLRALRTERDRVAAQQGRVVSVQVQLAAERDATLRLAYQVRGTHWLSTYRATLDADKATVRLERQAVVTQSSGEDWNGVQLRLSTGAPQRNTEGRLPRPWTLDAAPPPSPRAPMPTMARSKAAPAAMGMAEAADQAAPPDFEVQATESAYTTEFAVPGRTTVASSTERTTLSLGSTQLPVRLLTRTAPAVEAAAYLVAELARPPGIWPAGPVALAQGERFVGNGRLDFGAAGSDAALAELAFGRDDRVAVRADPPQDKRGTTGLTGSRTERTVQSRYRVDNRHAQAIELQVLHASPVAHDDKIEVQSRYAPEPRQRVFGATLGTVLWQQPLAAGASAEFTAEHTIRYPADLPVQERR